MQPVVKRHVSVDTVVRYWRYSLGIGVAVIGAVALLLALLTRTVEKIEQAADQIWVVGKLIANNTVHIPLLIRTNQLVAGILPAADGIERATARIEQAVTGASDDGGPQR
ncbi:MAG TPA: hypothetical protein VGR16_12700 [Thermomicrobiales bacterium]|nr:hypothetical protein [Thermomicrobiales bacterium]